MSNLSNNISLSELIAKVKEELESTNKDSPVFLVEKAELELQVTFSKEISGEVEGKGKSELKVQVLGVDFLKMGEIEGAWKVARKANRENVHKINLTLTPAINLSEEAWKRLKPELQQKIEEATPKVILQGGDEDI